MERTIGSLEGDPARSAARRARLLQRLLGLGLVLLGLATLAGAVWMYFAHFRMLRDFAKLLFLGGLVLTGVGANKLWPGSVDRLDARMSERERQRMGGEAGLAAMADLPSRPHAAEAGESAPGEAADDTALVRQEFPKIETASNDLLSLLPDDQIRQAIALAAGLAGLRLLRAGGADLSKHEPGTVLLGAVADDDYRRANRFVFHWARGDGLTPPGPADLDLPDEDREYSPEVARLEAPFSEICRRAGLLPEHDVYAALNAAMKIVSAGKTTGLLDERAGLALVLYHFLTGSKIVPAPA